MKELADDLVEIAFCLLLSIGVMQIVKFTGLFDSHTGGDVVKSLPSRTFVIIDSESSEIIDRETYGPYETVVIDVNAFRRK